MKSNQRIKSFYTIEERKGIIAVKEADQKHVLTRKAAKSFLFSEALVKRFTSTGPENQNLKGQVLLPW